MPEHLESHYSDDGKEYKQPKKSWPNMSDKQRDEVYETHREALAGDLKTMRETLGTTIWDEVASADKNYEIKKTGRTISKVMLEAFEKEKGKLGKDRSARDVMFYSLDYLQNGEENQGRTDNIDLVEKDDDIEIYKVEGRWKLKLTEADGNVRIDGFLFPPKLEEDKVEPEPEPEPEPKPKPKKYMMEATIKHEPDPVPKKPMMKATITHTHDPNWRENMTEMGSVEPTLDNSQQDTMHMMVKPPEDTQLQPAPPPEETIWLDEEDRPSPENGPDTMHMMLAPENMTKIREMIPITADPETGLVTYDSGNFMQFVEMIKDPEQTPELEEDRRNYMVDMLTRLDGKMKSIDFNAEKTIAGEMLGALADSLKEALEGSQLSAAVKLAISDTADKLKEVGGRANDFIGSITDLDLNDFTDESKEELLGKIYENYEYFSTTPPFDEIMKEGEDVFESGMGLQDSLDELETVLPGLTNEVGTEALSEGDLINLTMNMEDIFSASGDKINFDSDRIVAILKNKEAIPEMSDNQRELYIDVVQRMDGKLEGMNANSPTAIGDLMIALGNSLKEAVPGATFESPVKEAFNKVGDALVKFGKEVGEFVDAILSFDPSEVTPEMQTEIMGRFEDLFDFFKETPPFDKVISSFTNMMESYGELTSATRKLTRTLKHGRYLGDFAGFGDVPLEYFAKEWEKANRENSGEFNMERLKMSIPYRDRTYIDPKLFDEADGGKLYATFSDIAGSVDKGDISFYGGFTFRGFVKTKRDDLDWLSS
jgi:hypothetical protein